MIVYGYAIDYKYTNDNILQIKVRVPSIHGPLNQKDARGNTIKNYVREDDLPYYDSVLLPQIPSYGEIVALSSISDSNTNVDFLVIGLMGSTYQTSQTKNLT